jgi:hypothetical protein
LRRLTLRHPTLVMDALERAHRLVDEAEAKLRKALRGDHLERSLRASLFILSHGSAARERGWGRHGGARDGSYDAPAAAPTVVIWAGDSVGLSASRAECSGGSRSVVIIGGFSGGRAG